MAGPLAGAVTLPMTGWSVVAGLHALGRVGALPLKLRVGPFAPWAPGWRLVFAAQGLAEPSRHRLDTLVLTDAKPLSRLLRLSVWDDGQLRLDLCSDHDRRGQLLSAGDMLTAMAAPEPWADASTGLVQLQPTRGRLRVCVDLLVTDPADTEALRVWLLGTVDRLSRPEQPGNSGHGAQAPRR